MASIFTTMPRDALVAAVRAHPSRSAFLRAMGFKKTKSCLGLEKRLALENLSIDDLWPDRNSKIGLPSRERHILDLNLSVHAYFYGLALADGSLRCLDRNRGYLALELNRRDEDILLHLQAALPWQGRLSRRARISPFDVKALSETTTLRFHGYDLRRQLKEHGFPEGKKSGTCAPPASAYSKVDFWRGYIDGDGSVGLTADGWSFVSLVTVSDPLARAYQGFLKETVGVVPSANRNVRDGAYNIMVTRKAAVRLCRALYLDGVLAMERKRKKAKIVVMAGADVPDLWRD